MKERLLGFAPIEMLAKLPKQKLLKIIIIVGVVAVLGIFLSESFGTSGSHKSDTQTTQDIDLQDYEKQVEARLTDILGAIDGIGACRVMVTVDSSQESVYSSENESQSQSQ